MTIYCHTNRVNGKRYVGQTKFSMEKRWADHLRDAAKHGCCRLMSAAIRKYGPGSFDHDVLATAEDRDEANRLEAEWIARLGSLAPYGYNLESGGRVSKAVHESTRARFSAYRKQWHASMSPEERRAWSEQRSAIVKKWWADMTPERRAEVGRSMSEKRPKGRGSRGGPLVKPRKKYVPRPKRERPIKIVVPPTPEEIAEKKAATRAKRSANIKAAIAARSPEYKRQISAKALAALTPEQRSERARIGWSEERRAAARTDNAFLRTSKEENSNRQRGLMAARTPEQRSAIAKKGNETRKLRRDEARRRDAAAAAQFEPVIATTGIQDGIITLEGDRD